MVESLTSASWEVTVREMVGGKECHHRYWS